MVDRLSETREPQFIAPVKDIWTGELLDQKAIDAWARNGGIAVRQFCPRDELPDNVIPIDEPRLRKEVRLLCSHLIEPPMMPCPVVRNANMPVTGKPPHFTELL